MVDSPDVALLASSCARARLQGIERIAAAGGPVELLLPLLEDDAPYLYAHAGRGFLAEVRADALVAVEDLYRAARREPDFGMVLVRKAMPAESALGQASMLLSALPQDQAEAILAQAEADLALQVQPQPFEHEACRAYRVLQLLERVPYERQRVDPRTWLTPLQAQVHGTQVVSDRPRPCLRLGTADAPLGWVYRRDGQWVQDFSESPDARRAQRMVGSIMRAEGGQLPRVVGAAEGAPRRSGDGSLVLDGTVPRDVADPFEYLASLAAFCDGLFPCELQR